MDHFMPHGFCYLWTPRLLWLHVVSDSLIALSYTTIPFTLVWFVRKRKDLPFDWMFLCFGLFIVACGATHYMEIWNTWNADYWAAGWVKLITAGASVVTAALLVPLMPKAVALPSPEMYRVEIDERRRAEAALHEANVDLENRVALRTAELARSNAALEVELTERKRAQEELVHARKMEAVGRLAGGIAHDFNNLLMVVLGNSELILTRLPGTDPNAANARDISSAATRAASLTQQLLAFGRKQVLQPRVLCLNETLCGMEAMIRGLCGENIQVAYVLHSELGNVKADPGQMEQVVVNLLLNARDAMPKGGWLTVETENAELTEKPSRHGAEEFSPGPFVKMTVRDTGHGIPPELFPRLFEPFFTTKALGQGTGLGLATVYGILSQSGGYVSVDSEVGRGSALSVYLPRVELPEPHAPDVPANRAMPRGDETLLLVEDEASVRKVTRQILENSGFRVLEADSGKRALEVMRGFDGCIDLMVTDVVMPGMSGRELADHARQGAQDLPVIFISAHTDDALLKHGVEQSRDTLLSKPVSSEELVRKVRRVLDERRPA